MTSPTLPPVLFTEAGVPRRENFFYEAARDRKEGLEREYGEQMAPRDSHQHPVR